MPAVNGEKILTVALDGDMGEGPVQATGRRRRLPADRHPHPGRPTARSPTRSWCPPKPIRAPRFSWSPPTTPGVTVTSLDTTGHGSVGHLELHGVELGADRVVGGGEVVVVADHARHAWAAAHFSSACSSARWS